jgi:hypothetical protein
MQQCIKILLFLILNEAQHVSGDTAHHQEPKTAQAASVHTWKFVARAVVGRCHVATCAVLGS